MTDRTDGNLDVLVIGAGQAGLGTGHWLARRTSLSFLVVDGAERLGESWRRRWDSLVLFTPRRLSSLPGTPMPRGSGEYASKDEMADYLAAYAARERLPVRLRTRVRTLTRGDGGFVAVTTTGRIRARHVVVATGPYTAPFVPDAASGLDPAVAQLHSSAYRVGDDLPGQDVLVVGAGNSAAQLAVELAGAGRRVTVAAPGGMWFLPSRVLGVSLYWWLWLAGVLNSPSTSRVSRMVRARGDGIIGRDLQELVAAGTVRMVEQRVVGARGRTAVLADGTEVPTDAVLWCTGYRPALDWVRVPGALDEQGWPVHDAGRSTVPGLHWVGLPWQTRLNSGIVDGVDRDARQAVRRIAADHLFGPGRTAMDDDASGRPARAVSPPPDTDRAARPAPTAGEAA
jgi:putative flavoprotein involved in K+ transport